MIRIREYRSNRAFISNLPFEITAEEVRELFEPAGDINRVILFHDDFKKFKGSGFVEYKSPASVDIAIKSLNNMLLKNRNLFVRKDTPPDERLQV